MDKRIALVTGGTSGVGLSLVRALVERDSHVHFIGTSSDKGRAIESELNGSAGRVCDFIQLDLSDLGAVRAFARRFRDEVQRLDVLLNVAGLMLPRRQVTPEGFEKTFAIGYLSAVLLAMELVPALARASGARILNVAGSPRHVLAPSRLDLSDLAFEKDYGWIRAATGTIHAKVVATEILAERLRGRGIDVNAFHPGVVKGQLFRNMPPLKRALFSMAHLFMTSESKTGIYVSTAEEIRGITGQLFVGERPRALRFEPEHKTALWEQTERMLARVPA